VTHFQRPLDREAEFSGTINDEEREKLDDEVEYEDEEIVATVTVVDDLNLDDLHNGQAESTSKIPALAGPQSLRKAESRPPISSAKNPPSISKKRRKQPSFESKGERLQRKREEKARRVKQAIIRRQEGTTERRRLKKMDAGRRRRRS